ncbi:MAG: TIGR00159 family protein [Planctomycetes bacterium]|nr:TIGR00159 family protein [Planctomycetota bacterium]
MATGLSEPWEFLAEILLIGLSVNWCANVLQGTRGTRLLRGLLILLIGVTLVVRVMAEQFGWSRLELLYRYFVVSLAFIALIAFQPELRRALLRAGDVRFLRRRRPTDKQISALVQAAGHLSRERHGALIAIQREVGLANWAEAGVQINADVSADLLNSVFYPNSPLHDLGVVIRGNRLVAAACQFPLAESGETDPTLGSRHRAAVGLSQESDALVLVVSEETGSISLADSGILVRHLSLDELERELEQRLNPGPAGVASLRGLRSFADLKRLVRRLAVVLPLTLMIWFLADQASLTRVDGVRIALNVVQSEAVHVDVEQPQPLEFRLAVRGATRDVDAMRAASLDRPLRVDWNVKSRYTSPGAYRLTEREIIDLFESLPDLRSRGVLIEGVAPNAMSLAVDEVVTTAFAVKPDSASRRIADARFEPAEALITMRRADLERLPAAARVVSARVAERVSDATSNETLSLEGVVLDAHIGPVTALRVDPPVVRATLRVASETTTVKLARVPVLPMASYLFWRSFELQMVDDFDWVIEIDVEGDRAAVEALRVEEVLAFFSLSSNTPINEVRTAEVQIMLPAGMRVVSPTRQVQYKLVARESPAPARVP